MKIAVDLDGVVFQFLPHLLELVKKMGGMDFTVHGIEPNVGWNVLETHMGYSAEESKKIIDDYALHGYYLNAELIPGARYVLYKMHHEDKHEIIFITSRPASAMFDTYTALMNKGFPFNVYFSDKENTKAELIKALECDVLIEDRWEYLKETKDLNPDVLTVLFNAENQLPQPKDWSPDHYYTDWYTMHEALFAK